VQQGVQGDLVLMRGIGDYTLLGETLDDAAGFAWYPSDAFKRQSNWAALIAAESLADYPMLETMAVKGGAAADLSQFGVEPLEFSQALKLILERRRISQDLLKSQFGSSARATNILSALEVKEFIHKPEGTNRWEIRFDTIEDYMKVHFPQVPIDRKD